MGAGREPVAGIYVYAYEPGGVPGLPWFTLFQLKQIALDISTVLNGKSARS